MEIALFNGIVATCTYGTIGWYAFAYLAKRGLVPANGVAVAGMVLFWPIALVSAILFDFFFD